MDLPGMSVSRRLATLAAAASITIGTTACIGPFESCEGVGNFGVQITVVDSVTGRAPVGTAVLILTEGEYTESAQATLQVSNGTLIVAGAHERPGTYSLRITVAGYQPWTASGVRVSESGRCDEVDTVKLTARLRPV
jgi:hypothetical protein